MKINKKSKIFIISGAGCSAPSGLQTFRDTDGLWANNDINKVCNALTFFENYELIHKFYNDLRNELKNVNPNKAHKMIAKLQEKLGVDRVINITTNVDDLFERAGVKNTLYLHGKLTEMKNLLTGEVFEIGYDKFKHTEKEKIFKPNIIFFNEMAPNYEILKEIRNGKSTKDYPTICSDDIVIFIGMSFQVIPAEKVLISYKKPFTVNINTDSDTNMHWNFKKSYECCAELGLEQFLNDYIY